MTKQRNSEADPGYGYFLGAWAKPLRPFPFESAWTAGLLRASVFRVQLSELCSFRLFRYQDDLSLRFADIFSALFSYHYILFQA